MPICAGLNVSISNVSMMIRNPDSFPCCAGTENYIGYGFNAECRNGNIYPVDPRSHAPAWERPCRRSASVRDAIRAWSSFPRKAWERVRLHFCKTILQIVLSAKTVCKTVLRKISKAQFIPVLSIYPVLIKTI